MAAPQHPRPPLGKLAIRGQRGRPSDLRPAVMGPANTIATSTHVQPRGLRAGDRALQAGDRRLARPARVRAVAMHRSGHLPTDRNARPEPAERVDGPQAAAHMAGRAGTGAPPRSHPCEVAIDDTSPPRRRPAALAGQPSERLNRAASLHRNPATRITVSRRQIPSSDASAGETLATRVSLRRCCARRILRRPSTSQTDSTSPPKSDVR